MSTSKKSNRGYLAWVVTACAAFGIVVGLAGQAHATSYVWNSPSGGNWDDASWTTAGYPSAAGDTATISQNITADQTLHIDVNNATVGTLTFGDTTSSGGFNNWTIDDGGAGNVLTLNNNVSAAGVTSNNGNNVISASVALSTAVVGGLSSGGTVFSVNGGSLTLSGGFTNNSGGYTLNNGLLILSGNSQNTGDIITKGTLRIAGANALGSGNLSLTGGVLETSDSVLGVSGFTRNYGVAAGQFQIGSFGGSGFSAFGGNLTINIGGSVTPSTFSWSDTLGPTSGSRITFGSATANATVVWKNPILLTTVASGAATRYFTIFTGVGTTPEAEIQGAISETPGSVGTVQIGTNTSGTTAMYGTIVFSGANTYAGPTIINYGTLRLNNAGALPSGNLIFGDNQGGTRGILESNDSFGTFTRSLGTGTNQVQWTTRANEAVGGFSAYGGNFTINIGGNATPTALTWGQTNFIGTTSGQSLVFGSRLANGTVLWENPLAVGTGATIQVLRGVGTVPEVDMQGVLSGTNGLSKTGAGTLKLSAANTFSGATGVSTGVLQLGNALALQNSTVTIGAANGLTFASGIGTFTVGGLAGAVTTSNFVLADTASSAVTLQAGNNSASTVYTGAMSGSGGLTKVGAGQLTLNGTNAYTGATAVNGGTLLEDFSTSAPTSNIIYNGITANGLALSGGTFSLKGKGSTTNSQTVGNLTVNAGASAIVLTPNSATGLTLTLGNTWARNNQGTLTINTSASGTRTVASSPFAGAAQSTTSTILPYTNVIDASGNNGWATVDNTGSIVRYTAYNGSLPTSSTSASANYSINGVAVTLAASESVNSLFIQGTGATTPTINLNGKTLTITSGGILTSGSTTAGTMINGTGQLGANDAELIVQVQGTATTPMFTVNSTANVSGGAGSLTKAGTGTMVINSANTYTGPTTINAGILQLGNNSAVQNSAVTVWAGSGLKFSAGINAPTIAGLNGSGAFALSDLAGTPAAVALSITGGGTYSGALSGLGGLTKTTTGTQILQGVNSYSGNTLVTGGTLVADNNVALSTTAASVTGGTLQIATGRTITNNITLNGSGATLLVNGTTQTGSLNLTAGTVAGTGTIGQAVAIAAGMHLAPGNGGIGTLTTGALALDSASQLDYDLGPSNTGDLVAVIGNLTLNGQLNLSGSFGPGTYELMTYTGTLTNPGTFSVTLPSYATGSIDTSTNGAVYLDLTAVPEPTSMSLLGLAAAGLLRRRRRVQTA